MAQITQMVSPDGENFRSHRLHGLHRLVFCWREKMHQGCNKLCWGDTIGVEKQGIKKCKIMRFKV
jgi:hypothetical protein